MLDLLGSRLWQRLAATFVAASVLPLLGAFLLTTALLESSVREDAAVREGALGDLAASLVHDYIARGTEKITTVSRLLATEVAATNGDAARKAVLARLNTLVEPPDAYLELDYFAKGGDFVVNAQQEVLTNAQIGRSGGRGGRASALDDQNSENLRRSVVRTPLELGTPFVGELEENAGFATLPISVPMTCGDVRMGAVVAYLDFRRVNALLGTLAQGGYRLRLLDGAGKALAEAGEAREPSLSQSRPVHGSYLFGAEGTLKLAQDLLAGHGDWHVEVREPAERVYAAVGHVRRQVELWAGLGSLLAVALSIVIAGRIVRPIAALSSAARAMESGDLKTRAGIVRGDEIGRLAANFDRMAASLERLDDAKSEFVANVSHELRTPLTAICLSIANLLDGVLGPVEGAQRETLARAKGDVDRMIRLVNDLLEVARLDAAALSPRKEPLDLAVVAREATAALEPLARAKRIAVSVEGAGSATADRSMIHRVVTNLVDNAIKFTPEGGRVTVTVQGSELRVQDSGPGVQNERLFEKFSQAPVHGVKPRGTGLGLAIVKKLVELHGGGVRHEPSPGGACFVVTL
jgi:signal transduction histidine kinase